MPGVSVSDPEVERFAGLAEVLLAPPVSRSYHIVVRWLGQTGAGAAGVSGTDREKPGLLWQERKHKNMHSRQQIYRTLHSCSRHMLGLKKGISHSIFMFLCYYHFMFYSGLDCKKRKRKLYTRCDLLIKVYTCSECSFEQVINLG